VITGHSQRWRDGRTIFVQGDRFDAAEYAVDAIDMADARGFVLDHHYSRSYPADRFRAGLWRSRAGAGRQLVGVAVFSVPMNQGVVPKYTGLAPSAGVELGRLVLLDDVALPGETWFVSRAFRAMRAAKPNVETVVSYADPRPRFDAEGRITKRGHVGKIYAALSSRHLGKSPSRVGWQTANGQDVSERALSKIRGGECGRDYAMAELLRGGARRPREGETGATWLRRLEAEGFLCRSRHPGKHVYAWGLTRRARFVAAGLPSEPYPMVLDPTAVDVSDLPLFAAPRRKGDKREG